MSDQTVAALGYLVVLIVLGVVLIVLGVGYILYCGRQSRCTRGGKEHKFEEVMEEEESFPPTFDPQQPTVAFVESLKLRKQIYKGHVCTRCGKVVNVAERPEGSWTPPPMGPVPKA